MHDLAKFVCFIPCIGGKTTAFSQCYRPRYATTYTSLKRSSSEISRRHFVLPNRSYCSKETVNVSFFFKDPWRADNMSVRATSAEYVNQEFLVPNVGDEVTDDKSSAENLQSRPKPFVNRFLNFVRIGSLLNGAAESFFKSEIRRRLFVTGFLLVISRVGYFVPLPGYDRRLIPENYLSFVAGSVGMLIYLSKFFLQEYDMWMHSVLLAL